MAYREAKTDKEKKRGKSTDELSFDEALTFFRKRGAEKGSTKFRWRGDAYTTDGKKIGGDKTKETVSTKSSAPSESSKPKARPETRPTTRPKARQTGRGDGVAEMARRALDKPAPTRDRREGTTLLRSPDQVKTRARFPGIARIQSALERLPKGTDYSSNEEALKLWNALKAEARNLGPDAKRDFERVRRMFGFSNQEGGGGASARFNKGGMVRKGNTNYKGKGMFYKSASPKGFK